jgi:hypothetical protein
VRWVAQELFTRKPSYEQDEFLETWQSHLPGIVGDFYEVPSTDLLEGIALLNQGSWVYSPSK